jgi:hypothetical protein
MDRAIIYPGALPIETDLLNAEKNAYMGLAKLAGALFGTANLANGLTCTATSPAGLNVLVGPGEFYSLQNVDGTAYSSLAADTAHSIVKQGVLLNSTQLSCPAPGTPGYSINYLIEAAFVEEDENPVVLPYYNASNPAQAYSGPGGAGTAQNTVRQDTISLVAKAGVAAATGTQTTPAADSGYAGLWVVTVANGQATIASANIAAASGAPFLSETLLAKISQATADLRYAQITNAQTNSYKYGVDTGAVNAYAIALTPALTAHVPGMIIVFKAANANTGASTISINGLAAVQLITPAGVALDGGEIDAGIMSAAICLLSGSTYYYQLLAPANFGTPLINIQYFTSSGTYYPTPGARSIVIEVQGGGGAGGGPPATASSTCSAGGGGGAGGWARKRVISTPGSNVVTIGAGGVGTAGGVGGTGGTTSFGPIVSATGGWGGSVAGPAGITSTFNAIGGAGGSGSGGDVNITGQTGPYSSVVLGNGVPGAFNTVGVYGISYGAGGGINANSISSGAVTGLSGAPGLVIVYEYA